jgi:hypothetical protein
MHPGAATMTTLASIEMNTWIMARVMVGVRKRVGTGAHPTHRRGMGMAAMSALA